MMAYGRPPGKSAQERFAFEVAWEVCNKVGGIYTVLRTKAAVTVKEMGENYYLIGPYVEEKMRTEVEIIEPENFYIRAAVQAMRNRGVVVVVGRWLIEGNPKVILFDINSAWKDHNEWRKDFWNVTHISVPDQDQESLNAIMFGELVTWFLGEFQARNQSNRVTAHFHEWQAGVACILARTRGFDIATIFTTHATLLGRYLCAGSKDFYNNMAYFDCEREARDRGIHHRYCIEMASCQAAHIFTTVSRITQDEAEHLLKRRPDVITPNGLNVKKFSAIHEFQNLHSQSKQKINNFVQGHFYGHMDFDLDKTVYLFSAGRNEYFNKGVDLFLESLDRLNRYMQAENVDQTVVAFLIFPAPTNNYNIESLNGQAQHKKLREGVDKIQHSIGEKIFDAVIRGQMPPEKLLTRDDEVLLKKYLYSTKRTTLPPIVTHNVIEEGNNEIMQHICRVKLFNNHHDKVKVIYHPEFLSSTSPLFNIDYDDFVRGCHLGVFPSYYEPWGYTPAECTVMGIPSITTNLSGFGCFMAEHIADPQSYGIYIVDRRFKSPEDSVEQLAQQMLGFTKQNRRQRIIQRNRTERLSDLLDWDSLGMYYVRARHMALKALDPSYEIPVIDDEDLFEAIAPRRGSFHYPRPASAPASPTQSRRSSVCMDSDEEDEDREMIEGIQKKFMMEGNNCAPRAPPAPKKQAYTAPNGMGDIMDRKADVTRDVMTKVKAKDHKRGMLKEIKVMSAVRPVEDVSLLEVKQHYNILTNVNKELGDIKVTKKKKRNLMKEVEERGEAKENKGNVLAEIANLGKLQVEVLCTDVGTIVTLHNEKKKKDNVLLDIKQIGEQKDNKSSMQRELVTISTMRDAKAGAMKEIRDKRETKEHKNVVMGDIGKLKQSRDARITMLGEINKMGELQNKVFNQMPDLEAPLPKVFSGKLGVIEEINERGHVKESKQDALHELVTKHHAKEAKGAAMSELLGVADTKSKHAGAMQEIEDKAHTKEVKADAMQELLKVNEIKERCGDTVGDLPLGEAEKNIVNQQHVMKDIAALGKQKDTKQDMLKELVVVKKTKDDKKGVLGEINQIGQARNAKESAQTELKTIANARASKEAMNSELRCKKETQENKSSVLDEIKAKGSEAEQGRGAVEGFISKRVNQQNVLGEIRQIGDEKEEGRKQVEQLFAAKSGRAGILGDIRQIKDEKEEGLASVEKLFEARGNKSGVMADIRQIQNGNPQNGANGEPPSSTDSAPPTPTRSNSSSTVRSNQSQNIAEHFTSSPPKGHRMQSTNYDSKTNKVGHKSPGHYNPGMGIKQPGPRK